jgi:NADH dehydrogenase [ubiquinone] 1 alpha subcomplex assembly factor 7
VADDWPTPLAERLAGAGPMPFRDYMAEALYAEDHGFYTKRDRAPATRATAKPDHVRALARDLAEAFVRFAQAHEPRLVDQGPGRGRLVRYLLATLPDGIREATTVTFVEPNLARRTRLLVMLQEAGVDGRVVASPRDLDPAPRFTIAKELVGSFPVHWLERGEDGWREVHVGFAEGTWDHEERLEAGPPSLARFAREHAASAPVGARYEVNLQVGRWLAALSGVLDPGVLAVLDRPLERPPSPEGSLVALRDGAPASPYEAPGELDLSAGVDLDLLDAKAEAAGLHDVTEPLLLDDTGRPRLATRALATPDVKTES